MKKDALIGERIIDILRKHHEGLPILKVAELARMHRHTVTKYIYELIGADVIQIREIGTAKVCLLKKGFAKRVRVLKRLKKRMRR